MPCVTKELTFHINLFPLKRSLTASMALEFP